jgi:hypothetical protein
LTSSGGPFMRSFLLLLMLLSHTTNAQNLNDIPSASGIPDASKDPRTNPTAGPTKFWDDWITRWAPSYLADDDFFVRNAFSKMMEQRCELYAYKAFPGPQISQCFEAANKFIDALDYKHIPTQDYHLDGSFFRVIFERKLLKFMAQRQTEEVLNALLDQLTPGKNTIVYLYDFLLTKLGTKEKTLEFIAVLFQDFSKDAMALSYMKELKGGPTLNAQARINLELYEETLVTLTQIVYTKSVTLKFFPRGSILNDIPRLVPQAYHFYVPAYVAATIFKNQNINRKDAKKAGFLFNDTYMAWDGVSWSVDHKFTGLPLYERFKNGLGTNPRTFLKSFFQQEI